MRGQTLDISMCGPDGASCLTNKDSTVDLDRQIGRKVKLARNACRLSLQELGRRVGVTYQQVQKYETGANRISASTLYRIAQATDVEVGYFFEGLDDHDITASTGLNAADVATAAALTRIHRRVKEPLLGLICALADQTPTRDT